MISNIDTLASFLISPLYKAESLQVGQSDLEAATYALHIIGAIFSISLVALSLYAWSRRRNTSLLFVSGAFMVFFVLILLDEILQEGLLTEFLSGLFELVILSLFFLTVVGIRRRNNHDPDKEIEPKDPTPDPIK